ncbi:MAG: outer membrane beta-barrel protein [Prevotella sp.]|nr:outer membrane beta-barrel protein [Prevotella sp.]
MKKIAFVLVALMMSVAANAQFEQGKKYIGASLSGLNLSYSGSEGTHFGLQAKGGYLFSDNLMGTAQVGYDKMKHVPYSLSLGVGGRYYIVQNGIYLGAGVNYRHANSYDDVLPTVQVGYAFFLNGSVTIEPELYYEQSFKNHGDYSKIGFRLGFGIYL